MKFKSYAVLLGLLGMLSVLALPARAADVKQLEAQVERVRTGFHGRMAVYMKNLTTGDEIALDADRVHETFSIIKVPIMVEVLRQAESGAFSLSDRIELKAADARWPSGVLYALDPGLRPTVKDLLTLMIIISDNAATDLLGDKVGRANVTKTMRALGFEKTTVEHSDLDWDRTWLGTLDPHFRSAPVEEVMRFPFEKFSDAQVDEAFRHVIEDTDMYFGRSTAREMGRLFEKMARGELVSKKASDFMLEILKKQQVNNRFPRYLRGITVAHKTGDGQPWVANDAGILWVNNQPIVLVVFTDHDRLETSALHDAIARVAALVARHYGGKLAPDFEPR
ncbi:MAG: serine hydrolase [Acidipila sp.]|nr:serine hydrolase [Acidipila sp.]